MALALNDKKTIVSNVNKEAQQSISALVADYRGLTVEQFTKLRTDARDNQIYLKVVRNTLAKRALTDTQFACLEQVFVGPTLLALSKEPSAPARLFKNYVKQHEALQIKGLAVNGRFLDAQQIDYVAKLPTYNEALATLMQVMKAPIVKFVRTLNEPQAKFVRMLAAIRDRKLSQS